MYKIFCLGFILLIADQMIAQIYYYPIQDSTRFYDYWGDRKVETNTYKLEQSYEGELQNGEIKLSFEIVDYSDIKISRLMEDLRIIDLPTLRAMQSTSFSVGSESHHLETLCYTPLKEMPLVYLQSQRIGAAKNLFIEFELVNVERYRYMYNKISVCCGSSMGGAKPNLYEDEIFNLIRKNPDQLPVGKLKVIPGLQFAMLHGQTMISWDLYAEASKTEYINLELSENKLTSYKIWYPRLCRELEIIFEKEFPHRILFWKDNYMYAGKDTKIVESKARLMESIKSKD